MDNHIEVKLAKKYTTRKLDLTKESELEVIEILKASYEENGWTSSISLYFDPKHSWGFIIDGHHRLQMAVDLKLKTIPVEIKKLQPPTQNYERLSNGGATLTLKEGVDPNKGRFNTSDFVEFSD